jgi:restriction system protein
MISGGPNGSQPIASGPWVFPPTPTVMILQQALVIPGDRTTEGVLVEAVTGTWLQLVLLLQSDPGLLFQIDPRRFEELIAGMFEKAGFDEVTLTPRSGDFGRDVIAVKNGFGCVRFIESAKRYGPGHLVPADDVRSLLGVLLSDQNATKGIVTTSSDFAPKVGDDPLIKPHMPYRLELVNGTELVKRLTELPRQR